MGRAGRCSGIVTGRVGGGGRSWCAASVVWFFDESD